MPRSSSGQGHRPLTAATRVQIPVGVLMEPLEGSVCASVAQRRRHLTADQEYGGSTPSRRTRARRRWSVEHHGKYGHGNQSCRYLAPKHWAGNRGRGPDACGRTTAAALHGPVAQLVSAPPCHGGGRRFEPGQGRPLPRKHNGRAVASYATGCRFDSGPGLAVPVGVCGNTPGSGPGERGSSPRWAASCSGSSNRLERPTRNGEVPSSILGRSSLGELAERTIAAAC